MDEQLQQVKSLLDEINEAIAGYDPVLKERARDIMLERAFPSSRAARGAAPSIAEAGEEGGAGTRRGRGRARTGGRRGAALDVAELLTRWSPETMAERALLGAYAVARGRAGRTVTSQRINTELKANDIPVPNITRAIESNLRAKPPLMVQKKKMGTTRQARKQYAITDEGIEFVQEKIDGGPAEGGEGEEQQQG